MCWCAVKKLLLAQSTVDVDASVHRSSVEFASSVSAAAANFISNVSYCEQNVNDNSCLVRGEHGTQVAAFAKLQKITRRSATANRSRVSICVIKIVGQGHLVYLPLKNSSPFPIPCT